MTRRPAGANARVRAAARFAAWRAEGVPTKVTAHEAWHLTNGKVGTAGDHSTPLNLSTVAQRMEGSR